MLISPRSSPMICIRCRPCQRRRACRTPICRPCKCRRRRIQLQIIILRKQGQGIKPLSAFSDFLVLTRKLEKEFRVLFAQEILLAGNLQVKLRMYLRADFPLTSSLLPSFPPSFRSVSIR